MHLLNNKRSYFSSRPLLFLITLAFSGMMATPVFAEGGDKPLILFGHPAHPLLVHFPIALLMVSVFLEALSLWRPLRKLRAMGLALVILGGLSILVARATGENAAETIRLSAEAAQAVDRHALFANLLTGIFGALIALRLLWWLKDDYQAHGLPRTFAGAGQRLATLVTEGDNLTGWPYGVYLAVAIVGLIFLSLTGYTGGNLVFGFGAGVQ